MIEHTGVSASADHKSNTQNIPMKITETDCVTMVTETTSSREAIQSKKSKDVM